MNAPKKYARPCAVCDVDISRDANRCTNGACGECHARHCTRGGKTSPGHGLNVAAARAEQASARVRSRIAKGAA